MRMAAFGEKSDLLVLGRAGRVERLAFFLRAEDVLGAPDKQDRDVHVRHVFLGRLRKKPDLGEQEGEQKNQVQNGENGLFAHPEILLVHFVIGLEHAVGDDGLYQINALDMGGKKTIKEVLTASHPYTTSRIARLEYMLDEEQE